MPCHTGDVAEHQPVTLRDPSSSVTATYVPAAGMICTSLADDGVEFLGQRRGVEAYITSGKTMGVPILYPWANRLSASKYAIDGGVVTLTPGVAGVRTDEHGVPIHGVLADRTLTVDTTVTGPPRNGPVAPHRSGAANSTTVSTRLTTARCSYSPVVTGGWR